MYKHAEMVERLLERESKLKRGCIKCGKPITIFNRDMCRTCYSKWAYYNLPGRKARCMAAAKKWCKEHPEAAKKINNRAALRWYHKNKDKAMTYQKKYIANLKLDKKRYDHYKKGMSIRNRINYYKKKDDKEKLYHWQDKLDNWKKNKIV